MPSEPENGDEVSAVEREALASAGGGSAVGATVRVILGIVFFVLGVIGALLPVVQGWMFFALSLVMFFPNHPRVDALMRRAERRAPRTIRLLRRLGFGIDDLEGISRLDVGELVHRHPHHHHQDHED